jgi:chemotaxis protein MotB
MSDHDDDEGMEPAPADMGWLLTFADLVSLLITFFVLLYSMKVVDVQRWDEIKGSFSGAFSIREPIYQIKPDQSSTIEKIDPIQADSLLYVEGIIKNYFKQKNELHKTQILRNYELDTLTISVPSADLFNSGTADMKSVGREDMLALADILRHLDNRIVVGAHTGTVEPKAKLFPSNWELAMMRSIAVANVLKEQGVTKDITTMSYGSSRFDQVAPQLPIGKRQQLANRVEIILHGEEEL